MKWLEAEISTTNEACDAISQICTDLGASGVSIEDSDTRMGNDDIEIKVKAYYPENYDGNIEEMLKEKLLQASKHLNIGSGSVIVKVIDEQDWANNWKKYYKPFKITSDIVIKPSWEPYTPNPGEEVIEMDPGMAFGTGSHETTRLCAQMLESYAVEGMTGADIGTGSGILAMIMKLYGLNRIECVDTDPVAVRVAKENIALNHMDGVNVVKGSVKSLPKLNYDIVTANIIADVILSISVDITDYLKKNSIFIASGIIRERRDEVLKRYRNLGFVDEKVLEIGEWVGICFRWQGSL